MPSRLVTPGLPTGSATISRPVSVTATADLLLDDVRLVEQSTTHARAADALAHLLLDLLQVVDLGGLLEDVGLGHRERRTEARVEPRGEVARELDVLALVLADRHPVGLVEQDVGRLQDRVGEQPDAAGSPPWRPDLSLNWVIRLASPKPVMQPRTQASCVCAGTCDCRNSVLTSGSTPPARYCAAVDPRALPQLSGSCPMVIACRSTTQ